MIIADWHCYSNHRVAICQPSKFILADSPAGFNEKKNELRWRNLAIDSTNMWKMKDKWVMTWISNQGKLWYPNWGAKRKEEERE